MAANQPPGWLHGVPRKESRRTSFLPPCAACNCLHLPPALTSERVPILRLRPPRLGVRSSHAHPSTALACAQDAVHMAHWLCRFRPGTLWSKLSAGRANFGRQAVNRQGSCLRGAVAPITAVKHNSSFEIPFRAFARALLLRAAAKAVCVPSAGPWRPIPHPAASLAGAEHAEWPTSKYRECLW